MLSRFLQTLAETGRAELPWPGRDVEAFAKEAAGNELDRSESLRLLADWHAEAVTDFPGPPPRYHPQAALWGAVMCFRAACCICFREIGEGAIAQLLPDPAPADDAAAIFSADLCLRHWPDLARIARARSEDDPLVRAMQRVAIRVPLSSLGMHIPVDPAHPLFRHAGLRQYFAERALERADHACLAVPEIAAIIRAKAGAYTASLGRGLLPAPPTLPDLIHE